MKVLWEQKWLIIIGFPFMFLGGIGDFLFPNLIGIVMNAMKDGDKVAVASNLGYWLIIIVVGALSTMI